MLSGWVLATKAIRLSQNKEAIVDEEDFTQLSVFKWSVLKDWRGRYIAVRGIRIADGKQRLAYMARVIMGLDYGDPREVDHINHNTLDNRRMNLRIVTSRQNKQNQPSRKNSSSRFVGVTWDKSREKWRAQIQVDGRVINLGRFTTEEEAAERRDEYVKSLGTFHQLNRALR